MNIIESRRLEYKLTLTDSLEKAVVALVMLVALSDRNARNKVNDLQGKK